MESAAVLRSIHYSMGTVAPLRPLYERPGVVFMNNAAWLGCDLVSSQKKRAGSLVSCVKSSEMAVVDKSNGSVEKKISVGSTFPNGFEELVLGVCDETQIAELKMKIGGFEMHLKRNIKSAEPIMPVASPTEAPPIPSKPMNESTPVTASSPPTSQKTTPFTNVPVEKSRKLAALEASGASGYVLVSCPTVGTFRKSRTLKGKKQPVLIKEGDVIKEGQTICYLDQFGTELPVKSDAAGEVIKLLFDDGEAVGYGDPIIAVLPSFHDIK
uniref:biotin carboxyl carrier protein of acetyl-CoA carboxylase-like n=1 Tax=Erigeron canadensis TaxID=72917 RepID=UPI001CB950E8|nr:biotin carboxyl carrier protein of acetyl-CoA carboxylase-like [Erigeron canadensis]